MVGLIKSMLFASSKFSSQLVSRIILVGSIAMIWEWILRCYDVDPLAYPADRFFFWGGGRVLAEGA